MKRGNSTATILIIAAIIILGIIGYFAYVRDAGPNDTATSTSTTTEPGPVITDNGNMRTLRNTYITGFEGDNTQVTYEVTYPATQFTVSAPNNTPSTITLTEGGREHAVTIFNNVGAGFTNATEVYEGAGGKDFCNGCLPVSTDFSPRGGTTVRAWASAEREVIIYSQAPGFVILKLVKPTATVKQVLGTLTISATRAANSNPTSTIKLYFLNTRLQQNSNSCNEVFAVTRTIAQTPIPATTAINLLVAGPTAAEQAQGYTTALPAGTILRSLNIVSGIAQADFNANAEAGGGSCSMQARTTQINKTLMQFPSVTSTRLTVNGKPAAESFQP